MEATLTEELDEEEQLVRRHRKEKKELQGDEEESGKLEVIQTQGRARSGLIWGDLEGRMAWILSVSSKVTHIFFSPVSDTLIP